MIIPIPVRCRCQSYSIFSAPVAITHRQHETNDDDDDDDDDDDEWICRARHKKSSDTLSISQTGGPSECRANVRGERVAVRRAAGKLFQMTAPATAELLIPSVVLVLGTDSNPVPADRR